MLKTWLRRTTYPLKSCQPCSYLVHYCIAGSLSRKPPASSSCPHQPWCRSPWPCPLRTAPSVGFLLDSSISLPASLSTGVLLAGAQPPARIPASARVDPGRRSRTAQFQLSATSLGLPAPLASVIFPAVGPCLISYHVGEDPFPCLSSSPCLWHRPQSSCCSAMASCWKAPPPALPARRSISPLPACPTPLRLASSNVLLPSSAMRCPWCRSGLLVTPRSSLPIRAMVYRPTAGLRLNMLMCPDRQCRLYRQKRHRRPRIGEQVGVLNILDQAAPLRAPYPAPGNMNT
jgi:hypothetical protein